MSDDIRCFMVVNLVTDAICLKYKTEKNDRRDFDLAMLPFIGFAKKAFSHAYATANESDRVQVDPAVSRFGMIYGETNGTLAYLVFVRPDYPRPVAEQLADKHASAVDSMASDDTFQSAKGTEQSAGAKKVYAAVCKTLATEYEGGDKVSKVMREADQVKGVMSENINQATKDLEAGNATEKDRIDHIIALIARLEKEEKIKI